MKYYFLILGVGLIAGSLYLLIDRLSFLRRASRVTGDVSRVRRMDYAGPDDGGPSMHIEVAYLDDHGEKRTHIVDNSLLAYAYHAGEPVELAISGKKVIVNSSLNILSAPVALFIFGAVMLSLYVSAP